MQVVHTELVLCDYQAGASSMWASCCGLLNEVMGTGAVRGQQPGFGAGAGPFRFAPSAGYSTYPPTSSGSPGLVCKACGQAFSVFRRKVGIWIICVMSVQHLPIYLEGQGACVLPEFVFQFNILGSILITCGTFTPKGYEFNSVPF